MITHKIMYVCEDCADNNPESCGHYDRNDLRVLPDGKWICDGCYDDLTSYDLGLEPDDDGNYPDKPNWSSLKAPPAYAESVP